jgi:hypothetical protein
LGSQSCGRTWTNCPIKSLTESIDTITIGGNLFLYFRCAGRVRKQSRQGIAPWRLRRGHIACPTILIWASKRGEVVSFEDGRH